MSLSSNVLMTSTNGYHRETNMRGESQSVCHNSSRIRMCRAAWNTNHRCHGHFTEARASLVERGSDQEAARTATVDCHSVGARVLACLQVSATSNKVVKGILLLEQLRCTITASDEYQYSRIRNVGDDYTRARTPYLAVILPIASKLTTATNMGDGANDTAIQQREPQH